jgi:hypothetical protein
LITALTVAGVAIAGSVAIGANIGILDSTPTSDLGHLTVADLSVDRLAPSTTVAPGTVAPGTATSGTVDPTVPIVEAQPTQTVDDHHHDDDQHDDRNHDRNHDRDDGHHDGWGDDD